MDDLVSKSKVIEHIARQYTAHGEAIPEWLHIGDLPSAQPERKKGNWFKLNMATYNYQCSECEKYSRAMYDFCPNCGADMRSRSC